jgi:hypothetical protein
MPTSSWTGNFPPADLNVPGLSQSQHYIRNPWRNLAEIPKADGLDALLNNEEIVPHFRVIAANLTNRGLYLVDLTHPRECSFWNYMPFYYAGQRNGVSVEIQWATNNPL